MDNSNWKRILLDWANHSGLFERSYHNLEQTDIEEFFIKFNEHLTVRFDGKDDEVELVTFLKEQYPEFEFHLDDDNHLSTSDYMYIYSILLHYCCVKSPERYFHAICESLHEQFQLVIASFFKALLNKELTKSNLRSAISEAVPKDVIISTNLIDSPIKTPRSLKNSPPTPKTNLLEERKKELNLLRAMLDTEKYERGFLEVQIKQYEEKINKLTQEQKTFITKIQELKNELLAVSTENLSPRKNMEEEQIKKRLRKEISEKEEIIVSLKSNIEKLGEEKDLISEKLSYAQEQVIACLEKIKDMDSKINDLQTENERKDETIEVLKETNNELVQFINETRNNGGNRTINDLNISAEYFDNSFTRNNTSSSGGSLSSPENLGRTVVDIQLREKENENRLLREEIDKMNLNNSKLVQHICELIIKYSKVFEICSENLITNEKGDVTETFIVFENYVEKLTENYLNSCNTVKSLNEEVSILNSQNGTINEKIKNLEKSIKDYEKRIDNELKEKNTLTKERNKLKSAYDECLHNLNDEIQKKNKVIEAMEKLQKSFDDLKYEKETQKEIFLKEVEEKEKIVEERRIYVETLENQIGEYSQKLALIETKTEDLLKEKTKISEEFHCLSNELRNANNVVIELTKSNDELQNSLKEVEIASENMANEIEKLVAEAEMKENTIKLLASELNFSDERNLALGRKIEHLSSVEDDLMKELNQTNMEMETIKKSIELTNNEKEKIKAEFEKYRLEKEELLCKLENESKDYKNEVEKYQEMYDEIKENIQMATERIQSLESDAEKIRQENEELVKKISEKDTEYENLRLLTETLKLEKNTLQQEMQQKKEALMQKIELLEENNRAFDREIGLIVMKIEENEEIMLNTDMSNTTLKKLKDNLNHLLNENVTLKKEINNLRGVISTLEQKVNELQFVETEIIEKNQKLSEIDIQLKSEKESFEKEKVYLNEKIAKLIDNVKNLENINSDLKEINSKVESSSVDLSNELKLKQDKNAELSEKVKSLQNEIDRLTNELQESKLEIEKSNDELIETQLEKDRITKELKEKLDDYQTFENETVKNLKNQSDLIKHLEGEQKKLNDDVIDKEKQISELQISKILLKDEYDKLFSLYNESKEREIQLNANLIENNQKIESLINDLNNLSREKQELQEEYEQMKNSFTDKIEIIEKQHLNEINLYKQKINENEENFKDIIKRLENEKTEIEMELRNCKDKIISLDDKAMKFMDEIAKMNLEQNEIIEKNNLLNEELTALQNRYKLNELNLIYYRGSINTLKDKVTDLENIVNLTEKDIIEQKERNEELQIKIELIDKDNAEQKFKSNEACTALNTHIERISYQLGESQAKIKQLEKDNDILKNDFDSNQLIIENLKSHNSKITNELKHYKDKYSELQIIHDELVIKNQSLKSDNEIMKDQFEKYEIQNSEILEKIKILQTENHQLENRIKNLTENCLEVSNNLEDLKKENEILQNTNKQLVSNLMKLSEIFQVNHDELINECQMKMQNLNEIQNENDDLKDDIEKLQVKLNNAEVENHKLLDNLTQLSLRIDVMQNDNEKLKDEIIELKLNVSSLELEKKTLETENLNSLANLKELQLREVEIMDERINLEKDYKEQILDLEKILYEKNLKIEEFEKMKNVEMNKYKNDINEKDHKINEYEMKMNEIERNYAKEKEFNEKLQNDIEILRAKLIKNRQLLEEKEKEWNVERQKLIEISETAENRIKENRLELEGKLDKMKDKMKTLYNDEITKIKNRHERELNQLRHEIEILKTQNKKYETHTQTLSKQIYELNEANLELQKQNKFMETRLKNSESIISASNLRRQHHYTSTPGLNPNLQMEDEEGEVFDNMYLTELKNGRKSPTSNRESISVDELKYRNSLAPPHLKSTYLAQYVDHDLPEDDIKDGLPINFDDSLSSLLHTGQRKKLTGTTLYKKPGPPTPSKNAGRLSLGGASTGSNDYSNHPREVLKEVHDSKKPTPSKFRFLSSAKSRDESLSEPIRILRERKKSVTIANGAFTSTPRKSKAHYDQRRQLDLYLNTSSSTYSTDGTGYNKMEAIDRDTNENHDDEIFNVKTPNKNYLKQNPEAFMKWRQPITQSPVTTTTTETSDSNSPYVDAENDSMKNNSMMKINRFRNKMGKDRRISIYSRGNVISNTKLPSNVIRNQMRHRAKQQRCVTFNKYRKSLNEITLRKSLLTGRYQRQSLSSLAEEELINQQQQQQQQKDDTLNNVGDNNEIISIRTVDSDAGFNSNDIRNYRFEQLLKNKESRSPFEDNNNITEINLITTTDAIDDGGGGSSNMTTSHCTGTTNLTAASSKTTIYTNSIIINRKIPHIDKTIARKMSLFLGSANGRGVILLAGQTISIMDLLILWNRLSLFTKLIFIIFFFAFILHIYFAMKN